MPERTHYDAGTPSWIDLTAIELEPTKAFYGELFGWEFLTMPAEMGHYTLAQKNGLNVAALMPRQEGQELPTMWNTYLATDDVDATLQVARDAGGTVVMEPMDIPEQGRVGYLLDPTGAPIGLWQARAHIGAQLVNEPGTISWNELHTQDSAAADAFYGKLFPYTFEQVGDGTNFDYAVLSIGGDMVAGRMRAATEASHWQPYFAVAVVDKTAEEVAQNGGKVLSEPEDSPYGRMSACQDPWGADFSIITLPSG
ncbi:MAG TPA: VOC family protein [Mycobacteriales bacterium]|jgi:hypothetical protein|nr:VOC family protein [Mycobacteriales bacterium]